MDQKRQNTAKEIGNDIDIAKVFAMDFTKNNWRPSKYASVQDKVAETTVWAFSKTTRTPAQVNVICEKAQDVKHISFCRTLYTSSRTTWLPFWLHSPIINNPLINIEAMTLQNVRYLRLDFKWALDQSILRSKFEILAKISTILISCLHPLRPMVPIPKTVRIKKNANCNRSKRDTTQHDLQQQIR